MAATTASSAWMPSKGRHSVNIGPSLGRAIKARKLKDSPAPTTKKISRPERDFYAFRFNFKPSSIDNTKPASIEIKKGTENSQVVAEYPSKESNNEVHVFNGTEQPAKDIECVLIYDEDTGQYTLEKLDSFVTLKSIGKKAISPRPASPAPAVSSSTSSSSSRKGKGKQELDDNDDLERAILGLDDADADGEVDDFMEIVPTAPHRPEEEHEEGEMSEDPPPPPSKPQPPPTKAAARPVKPLPKARAEPKTAHPPAPPKPTPAQSTAPPATIPLPPKPTPAPTPKPAAKQAPLPAPTPTPASAPPPVAAATSKVKTGPAKTKKTKAAAPSSLPPKPKPAPTTYPEEEVIELPRPTKRSRPSTSTQPHIPPKPAPPPLVAPAPLSLPGGSGVFAPPPPPKPTSAPASPPALPADESDDDSDIWEQVPTTAVSQTDELEREIFGSKYGFKDEFIEVNGDDVEPLPARRQSEDADALLEREVFGDVVDEEEIDVNAFAAELDQEMQSDADDDDMEEVVPGSATGGRPLSMNQLAAANGGVVDSDEEYSSSDDSDFD